MNKAEYESYLDSFPACLDRMLRDTNETDPYAIADEEIANAAASISLRINQNLESASPNEPNEEALKHHPNLVGFTALISEIESALVDYKLLKIHELKLKSCEIEIKRQEVRVLERLAKNDSSNATAVREVLDATVDLHLEMRSLSYSLSHYVHTSGNMAEGRHGQPTEIGRSKTPLEIACCGSE